MSKIAKTRGKHRELICVDYSVVDGATCPICGKKRVPPYSVCPWGYGVRVRYHKCCGRTLKSIQQAYTSFGFLGSEIC